MSVVGGGNSTTVTLAVAGQKLGPLTETVYVPGAETVIGLVVCPPGDHWYWLNGKVLPEAVRVEVPPGHMGVVEMLRVGVGFRPTVTLSLLVQP